VCQRLNECGGICSLSVTLVRRVRSALGLDEFRARLTEMDSPMEVIEHVLLQTEDVKTKIIVLLWSWWNERHRIRECEGRIWHTVLAQRILVYVAKIKACFGKQ
jgi:hypothetical protein